MVLSSYYTPRLHDMNFISTIFMFRPKIPNCRWGRATILMTVYIYIYNGLHVTKINVLPFYGVLCYFMNVLCFQNTQYTYPL